MKSLIAGLLIILMQTNSFAISFNFLSTDGIQETFTAEEDCFKTVHLLALNKNKKFNNIPVKVTYVIGADTLIDYLVITENGFRQNIKTLELKKDESLTVFLQVQNTYAIEIKKVKGNLTISDPFVLQSNALPNKIDFIGSVWNTQKSTMFRILKSDTIAERINFKINFNENFAYDKFYYQINVLSPDSSFYSLEASLNVNDSAFITLSPKILKLDEEIGIYLQGKYIIELVPLMGSQRTNGINSIEYEYVTKKD